MICGILLLFSLTSINELVFSSNFTAEAYPMEITGKVIINPPICQPGQTYDADSDECIQNDLAAPDNPVPTPPIDTPGTPGSIGPPRPLILTANASERYLSTCFG
jgi:hypothetical protein